MKILDFLLIGAAGLLGVMAIQNWNRCNTASYVVDANGNAVTDIHNNCVTTSTDPCGTGYRCAQGLVAGGGTCRTVTVSVTPPLSCLFNPFPGGL